MKTYADNMSPAHVNSFIFLFFLYFRYQEKLGNIGFLYFVISEPRLWYFTQSFQGFFTNSTNWRYALPKLGMIAPFMTTYNALTLLPCSL